VIGHTVSTPALQAASTSHGVSPTITASSEPALFERGPHEIGLRLRRLDVVVGGPAVRELAGVEQVEVVVELVLRRGAGEHDRQVSLLQVGDQLSRARERLDLTHELLELLAT
jgi:hypothetical protein